MSNNISEISQYIRAKEVLQMIPISRNTLYKLVEENRIPYKRVGPRIIMFSRKSIEKWFEEQNKGDPDERSHSK